MKNYELRIWNYELPLARMFGAIALLFIFIFSISAQSNDQNFPTPITANEISGRIPARDLGDARLTTFYYTFDGTQGDVFLNVVTTNFNGDIDVFTADNLRPLTKITAYADSPNSETGRVVYLRQPVKLILRIQGRTPNDDAATFQIKFAGSFAPSTAIADVSTAPEVKSSNNSDIRVNSVGTIIEVKPKPTPKEVIAKVEKQPKEKKSKTIAKDEESEATSTEITEEKVEKKPEIEETVPSKEIAVKEPKPKKEKKPKVPKKPDAVVKETTRETETAEKNESDKKAEEKAVEAKSAKETADAAKVSKEKKKSGEVKPVTTAVLENINLIILFKDGSKIERPMSEVLKVGVDKGILTVISKDGVIGRYSIFEVEKMTIQ